MPDHRDPRDRSARGISEESTGSRTEREYAPPYATRRRRVAVDAGPRRSAAGARADVDVLVAGAGAAGLTAALAWAQRGADVLLIDVQESFRHACNTALSTGIIPAAGTRWQAAAGVEDSPELFFRDALTKTAGSVERRLARALTSVSAEVIEWLSDTAGVEFELVTEFRYPGHSLVRCHATPGRTGQVLHGQLMAAIGALSRVTLVAPIALRDILLDEEGGVRGAVLGRPDASPEEVSTRHVVLATNGFGANRALVTQHMPEIAAGLYFGGHGSTGDALAIGAALGADVACLAAYQGHAAVAVPHGILVTWATVVHGGVLVNGHGRRFGDESRGYSEYAANVLAQPGGYAWLVLDRRIDRLCRPFVDYSNLVEAGALRWAADARELADIVGADATAVEQTLRAAAACALNGTADVHGRREWTAALEPPFGAVKVTGALFHTQGGLAVDEAARVLRGGEPIPGLFAAGGAAVGMSGRDASGYLSGNGLLAAVGLGYLTTRGMAANA